MSALGIDVSEARGLDLVLLDRRGRVRATVTGASLETLAKRVAEWRPSVVAIDAPPAWSASGGSRNAERELLKLNIRSYGTPSPRTGQSHPFYGWMRQGIAAFEVCRAAGYPRYRKGAPRGHALEVVPHASAAVLLGGLAPAGVSKRAWREAALRAGGVETAGLRTQDLVDAALAALTGLLALKKRLTPVGEPDEGVIVLPCAALPASPFRRAASVPGAGGAQPRLPGLTPCGCGDAACRETTSGEFAPGHDGKRKSLLWRRVREGDEARRELRRRGWEEPPDV